MRRSIVIDVAGLVLFSEENAVALFVNGAVPRTGRHGQAIPPHYAFIAVPECRHKSERAMHLMIDHKPALRLFAGASGLHRVYLLPRRNDKEDPARDSFDSIEIPSALEPDRHGTLDNVADVRDIRRRELPASTLNGQHWSVAVILNTKKAHIEPLNVSGAQLQFGTKTAPFAEVVRLRYFVEDSEPEIVIATPDGERETIILHDPTTVLESEGEGWHLFMGDVPLDELVGVSSGAAHDELHHFELIYDLYQFPPEVTLPFPRHEHHDGNGLGDPGFCGPPVRG